MDRVVRVGGEECVGQCERETECVAPGAGDGDAKAEERILAKIDDAVADVRAGERAAIPGEGSGAAGDGGRRKRSAGGRGGGGEQSGAKRQKKDDELFHVSLLK